MSYQSGEAYGSDFAKDAMEDLMVDVKEKLFEKLEKLLEGPHSEQAVLVHLRTLWLLGQEFPGARVLAFGSKDFAKARDGFNEWYGKCEKKIPAKYRKDLRAAADEEFARWDELLSKRPRPSSGTK